MTNSLRGTLNLLLSGAPQIFKGRQRWIEHMAGRTQCWSDIVANIRLIVQAYEKLWRCIGRLLPGAMITRSDKVCIVGKLECMLPLKHRSIFFPGVLSFLHLFASERDHLFGRCFCQDELHFPSLSLEGDRRSSSVPFHGNFCHLFPSYPDTFFAPCDKASGSIMSI